MNALPLHGFRALVSGAGVAGPAVAHWLAKYGTETTDVEVAPALRTSGFGVDFRGPTHMGVLREMGVLADLERVQTHAGAMRFVDERSREIFLLPAEFAGGELEVRRRDLSEVLYEHSADHAEYIFGDSIANLTETADGIRADFAKGASRTFDVVIGADGLHSGVRRLTFGDESRFVRHLGYYVAHWNMPNDLQAGTVPEYYNLPGRMASVGADLRDPGQAGAFCIFASPRLTYGWHDTERQKHLIIDALRGMGWHVPHLLDALRDAPDLYFDSISKVRMPRWSAGRVALLGDAGYGVTLGGMGVGTGIVGAYVLAGELAVARGNHRAAFAAYEQRLRRYVAGWQRGANPGEFLAPSTAARLWMRNSMFKTRLFRWLLIASSKSLATGFPLPDYPPIPSESPAQATPAGAAA
jgi:2-polyprenyl-6-methoxyphenol hydroxylase-like FAD-dependent oxidoreductase